MCLIHGFVVIAMDGAHYILDISDGPSSIVITLAPAHGKCKIEEVLCKKQLFTMNRRHWRRWLFALPASRLSSSDNKLGRCCNCIVSCEETCFFRRFRRGTRSLRGLIWSLSVLIGGTLSSSGFSISCDFSSSGDIFSSAPNVSSFPTGVLQAWEFALKGLLFAFPDLFPDTILYSLFSTLLPGLPGCCWSSLRGIKYFGGISTTWTPSFVCLSRTSFICCKP